MSALGAVATLFALALFQPWGLLAAREGDVGALETRPRDGAVRRSEAIWLEDARRCSGLVRPTGQRARPVCKRIVERRGGVETRLGKVSEPSRR